MSSSGVHQNAGEAAASPDTVLDALAHWAVAAPRAAAMRTFDSKGLIDRVCTWQELAGMVAGVSGVLKQVLEPDESIVLRCPNSPEFVAWLLGGISCGIRVLPVHQHSTCDELIRIARRADATVLVAHEPCCEQLQYFPAALAGTRLDGAGPESRRRGKGSVLLQSSGTTGLPRLARRSESSLDADARNIVEAIRLDRTDRVLAAVPLSHSYGVDLLVGAILAGASLDTLDGFDPSAVHGYFLRGGPTVFPGTPFMFAALARDSNGSPPRDLRMAFSAGSPLPLRVAQDVHQAWGLPLGQLYGATELGSVLLNVPGDGEFDPLAVGLPMRGVSVRVVDPEDSARIQPPGAEGELAISAPSMLDEYVGEVVPLVDGHFLTGDLGRMDDCGRVHVTGRMKHLIDVGGLKVNPLEIEQVFCEHPGVVECALIPLRLSDTVTKLRLLYVPRSGRAVSASELRAFARERLAPYRSPRAFDAVETLPRSATGKLLRHRLCMEEGVR